MRAWELSWPGIDSTDLRTLIGLEQGVYGGPIWLYDPFVARTNMLPPWCAVPGLNGDYSSFPDYIPGTPAVLPGGVKIPTSANGTLVTQSVTLPNDAEVGLAE